MSVQMIKPEPIDVKAATAAIDEGLLYGAETIEIQMNQVTMTWTPQTKPEWKKDGPKTEGTARILDFKTESTPFVWVDKGTQGPYPIPKSGPHPTSLGPFQVGYIRKTAPRKFASGPGGRFGEFVRPKQVMHPGIEPGNFTDEAAKQMDKQLYGIIQTRLDYVRSL
jgi:hypothetical protein